MASGLPTTSIVPPDQSSFYKPLPTSTSFWLLYFPAAAHGGLECRLQTYEIRQHPPFKALSYTWEQPYYSESGGQDEHLPEFSSFDYAISCDGRLFRIAKNLFNALTTLVPLRKTEYLWVDAICINQADTYVERPQQVSLMGHIFESANGVLIWLGHYISKVVEFVWSATTFVRVVEQLIEMRSEGEILSRGIFDSTIYHLLGGSTSISQLQKAMDFHGRCRIFRRAWVLQEFAKAKKARLFCGNVAIPLHGLFQLSNWFGRTSWNDALAFYDRDGICTTPYMQVRLCGGFITWKVFREHCRHPAASPKAITQRCFVLSHDVSATPSQGAFEWLLGGVFHLHTFQVSDPRDTIFAALSLGTFNGCKVIDHIVTPNYSASIEVVYTDFAISVLHNLPTLCLFCFLDSSKNRVQTEWPSWVPDWRSPIPDPIFEMFGEHNVWANIESDDTITDGYVHIHNRQKKLSVIGIPVTCIDAVPGSLERLTQDEFLAWLLEGLGLVCTLSSPYEFGFGAPESCVEAVWRTLIVNRTFNIPSNPPNSGWKSVFYDFLVDTFSAALHRTIGPAQDRTLEVLSDFYSRMNNEYIGTEIPSLEEVKDIGTMIAYWGTPARPDAEARLRPIRERAAIFESQADRTWRRRQLFRANNGILGSGLTLVKSGDQIWLLREMNTPVILRPDTTPDQFKIVGECYLHGCMNGELFSHGYLDRNSAKPIVIV